jgi:CheY-like chemotaxis protein
MDGYAACRRMRSHHWGKDLVIFAVTGWGHEEDRIKSQEAGFSGHLVKPVDTAALQRLLADPGAIQG